ncbi:unnamed protein product [Caenorhabditis sp. 36 PRJEB53466]|nr:unnamed protein product [Caenorhabditis sp. 36 PRJEB53466]
MENRNQNEGFSSGHPQGHPQNLVPPVHAAHQQNLSHVVLGMQALNRMLSSLEGQIPMLGAVPPGATERILRAYQLNVAELGAEQARNYGLHAILHTTSTSLRAQNAWIRNVERELAERSASADELRDQLERALREIERLRNELKKEKNQRELLEIQMGIGRSDPTSSQATLALSDSGSPAPTYPNLDHLFYGRLRGIAGEPEVQANEEAGEKERDTQP